MTRRLFLSYLLLILLTVGLLAAMVGWSTVNTFSHYLNEQLQIHNEMFPVMLAGYYEQQGGWHGVAGELDRAALMVGQPLVLADSQGRIVAATEREQVGKLAAGLSGLGEGMVVVLADGQMVGTVFVRNSPAQQRADEAFLAAMGRALVLAGLLAGGGAVGLGLLFSRSINRPVVAISKAAQQIAQGNYQARVPLQGEGEMLALAQTFNQMAGGLADVERLRRELVANVSHDLRTPLTVLQGYLEGLQSGQIADRYSAEVAFKAMAEEVGRLLKLVDGLRQMSGADSGRITPQAIDIAQLCHQAIQRLAPVAQAKGVALQFYPAGTPPLPPFIGDSEKLGQALFNLLENSVRHTPAGGQVTLSASHHPNQLQLTISDNGEGIPPEHLPHIFERFYRADPSRTKHDGGSGLGLSIVQAIVQQHNGQIQAHSPGPGQGATFTITLPSLEL